MIVYDDLEATKNVKAYDKGITVNSSMESATQLSIGYRAGDMWAAHLPAKEKRFKRKPSTSLPAFSAVRRLSPRNNRAAGNREFGGGVSFDCRARQSLCG
jgi:hypothetical protein